MKFSIVIPCYKSSNTLIELKNRLIDVITPLSADFEIVLVNDGSPDDDWEIITNMAKNDSRIKGINFSRNFGQHYAISAGLEIAKGEWIVVMDGDLQDRPEEIANLYKKSQEGYDLVTAKRVLRKDTYIKKMFSKLFYWLFGYLTNTKYDSTVANFGIYHQKVIHALIQMKDKIRVFPILIQWVGFKGTSIEVVHNKRQNGLSAYTYKTLFTLAFDIIVSFSNKPLMLMVRLGIVISILSFFVGIYYIYSYLEGEILILGFASIIISIWLLSGLIILFLGVLGIYLGKVFDASKDRPTYIIKEKLN